MVKVEDIEKNKLYREMVEAERFAYNVQDNLLKTIEKWFLGKFSEDVLENTKVMLDYGGYVKIRTDCFFKDHVLEAFKEDFNFKQLWFVEENMTDYRNVEPVSVTTFEYCFTPNDIDQILGDNQVDLKEA